MKIIEMNEMIKRLYKYKSNMMEKTIQELKERIFGRECDLSSVDNFIFEKDENYEVCGNCGQEICDCQFIRIFQENNILFDRIFPKEIL